jgi:hypothetical protein
MSDHCPACGALMEEPRYKCPAAERLHLPFVSGRKLYAIAGRDGLWFGTRKQHDPESESVLARGAMGEGLFYRATEVEERVKRAMRMMEVKP